MSSFIHRILDLGKAGKAPIAFAALLGWASAQESSIQFELVPDARSAEATEWRYSTDDPGTGWTAIYFEDVLWSSASGGFGTGFAQSGAKIGHEWTTPDIWLRKSFSVASLDFEFLILEIQHDEDVEVFLNGTEILTESFINGQHQQIYLTGEAKAALKTGDNVLAVHCRNLDGPGYIDAGLTVTRLMQTTTLVTDANFGGENWNWVDSRPGAGWNDTGFEAGDWNIGHSGFGSTEFSSFVGTPWTNYEIWTRKSFTVDRDYSDFLLTYLHDDEVEIFVNGNLILQESGSGTQYKQRTLSAANVRAAMGTNVLAVHCTNSGGGPQFSDAGLIGLQSQSPVGTRRAKGTREAGSALPRVLYAGRDGMLDLSAFKSAKGMRLDVFGLDGTLRVTLSPEAGRFVSMPSRLGAGTFRYRLRSPSGSGQGLLIRLP